MQPIATLQRKHLYMKDIPAGTRAPHWRRSKKPRTPARLFQQLVVTLSFKFNCAAITATRPW
jgi:hypothetical protein